jgi:hypothetical protein
VGVSAAVAVIVMAWPGCLSRLNSVRDGDGCSMKLGEEGLSNQRCEVQHLPVIRDGPGSGNGNLIVIVPCISSLAT